MTGAMLDTAEDAVFGALTAMTAGTIGTARIGAQLFSATERLGIAEAEAAINAWIADRTAGAQKERPRHQGE